jgi:hypothetical protein
MPDRRHLTAKIRSYLDELSPRAVQTLLRSLETARDRGSEDPNLDLILEACMRAARHSDSLISEIEPRDNWLQRLFFSPVEDLLVDAALCGPERGRIKRTSLSLIWAWLQRDVAPDKVREALDIAQRLETDPEDIAALAEDLREHVAPTVQQLIDGAHATEKGRQKLAMLVGGARAMRDLEDVFAAFASRPWLDALRESLPERLTEWDFKADSPSLKRIKSVTDRNSRFAFLVAAVVLRRVEAPESMMSLAAGLAGSVSVKRIATSGYAVFAEAALSEVERFALIATGECSNTALGEALNAYCRLVRVFDRQFEFEEKPEWQKRIAETRRAMSALVTRELDAMLGNVRRLLSVPAVGENGEPILDAGLMDEALRGVMLLNKMRDFAESLAVNEITARSRQSLEQSLEFKTRALLSGLAGAQGRARRAHQAAVDAAIELCEAYFGKDYADQLRRSRQAALAVKAKPAQKAAS